MDIERLINRHKDAVYRQMIRTCGNETDAEDALADALLAAIRASNQLKDPNNFQAWLARIGTRSCARARIRNRMATTISLEDLERKGFQIANQDETARQAELGNLKGCVTQAIELLPTNFREVYLRREIKGERAEDVASSMSLSVPAVKSRLHRARQMVREFLDSSAACQELGA